MEANPPEDDRAPEVNVLQFETGPVPRPSVGSIAVPPLRMVLDRRLGQTADHLAQLIL